MKLLAFVASLAVSSVACVVPSLNALDTRLAAVGIDPTPHKWSVEAQIRVAEDRKAGVKGPTDIPKRQMLWASSNTPATDAKLRSAVIGGTSTTITTHLDVEQRFAVSGIPQAYHEAVDAALGLFSADAVASLGDIYIHSLDCSQRSSSGWLGLMCDIEVGPQGRTLLSLSKGKVVKGVLRGDVTTHDVSSASKNNMKFAVLCDSDDDDDDEGKVATRAFALVITVPDTTAAAIAAPNAESHQRNVELVLRFSKAAETSVSDDGAPTTVIGADGTAVYLLRGNTILSRWVLPFAYGVGLIVALPYLAKWATKALTPKPAPVTVDVPNNGQLRKK